MAVIVRKHYKKSTSNIGVLSRMTKIHEMGLAKEINSALYLIFPPYQKIFPTFSIFYWTMDINEWKSLLVQVILPRSLVMESLSRDDMLSKKISPAIV